MFAGILLLGSLIIFNNDQSESPGQLSENPDIEHIELQATFPSKGATESPAKSNSHHSGLVYELISGKSKHPESMIFAEYQVRMKTQMLIHLELKPILVQRSGPCLYQPSSYDDPPVS